LSISLYRKGKDGTRIKERNHPVAITLKQPNYNEPKTLFYYQLVQDYFHSGNIFLYKYLNKEGELYSLFRLNPEKVEVEFNSNNQKVYKHEGNVYDYRQVLHIPSRYGYNGLVGKSIFEFYKQSFDLANSLDVYFRNSFNNGFGNGKRVILDVAEVFEGQKFTKEQIEEIKNKLLNEYTGYTNSEKPIIKTIKNAKYETLDTGSTTNREAQLNENINISQELICKLFNVPSSLLKGKNEYNGLESLYIIFLDFAVKPIVESIIDGFNSLLKYSEQEYLYIEADYNTLLRIDTASKIDAYTKQFSSGILTINEIRMKENLPSVGSAGDVLHIPANLLPLNQETIDARIASQKLALSQIDKNIAKTGDY
jgi:HK97 family phage portal protein